MMASYNSNMSSDLETGAYYKLTYSVSTTSSLPSWQFRLNHGSGTTTNLVAGTDNVIYFTSEAATVYIQVRSNADGQNFTLSNISLAKVKQGTHATTTFLGNELNPNVTFKISEYAVVSLIKHLISMYNEDIDLLFNDYSISLRQPKKDCPLHHSIETDIDGNIWVPSHIYPQSLPIEKVGREVKDFFDDAIVKLSPEGRVLYEKSVSQIFIDNSMEYLLFSVGYNQFDVDPIHLNDIQPVNYDSQYWKKGDVFLSLRHQSMILLYRPSTNKII